MPASKTNVSLKSLQSEVNIFMDELKATKDELNVVKKELKAATDEIRLLKEVGDPKTQMSGRNLYALFATMLLGQERV